MHRVLAILAIAAILIAGLLPVAVIFIAIAISLIAPALPARVRERRDDRAHDSPLLAFALLRAPPRS